ncbi:hypothetical protein Hdeb2414_s0019g00549051 [Helianthus debilis subsp. tardiflorus]
MSACSTVEMGSAIYCSAPLLQTPMEQVIRDVAPHCIFSDLFFTWTVDFAEELNIPRLLFYPDNFLYHSISHSFRVYASHANVKSEFESFVVPDLPDKITMKRSQVSHLFISKTRMGDVMERVRQSRNAVL